MIPILWPDGFLRCRQFVVLRPKKESSPVIICSNLESWTDHVEETMKHHAILPSSSKFSFRVTQSAGTRRLFPRLSTAVLEGEVRNGEVRLENGLFLSWFSLGKSPGWSDRNPPTRRLLGWQVGRLSGVPFRGAGSNQGVPIR